MTEKPVCSSCGKQITHRLGLDWCLDDQMSEADLQKSVIGRAKRRGWRVEHVGKGIATFDSEGNPIFVTTGIRGWPDLTLAKAGHRLVFMELKKQAGEATPEQVGWLVLLNQCGARAIIIRPSHLRTGRVNAILKQGSPL